MKRFCLLLLVLTLFWTGNLFGGGRGEQVAEDQKTTEEILPGSGTGQVVTYSTLQEYESATGKSIKKFSEAPMLHQLVVEGKIPPLEDRLPENPLLVHPVDQVGPYGGTWRDVHTGELDILRDHLLEFPIVYSSDMLKIESNLFTGWESRDNAKVWIFHLRRGIKWSDGHPFTTDDFIFWYEDVALNKELSPAGIGDIKVQGEMGRFEKIDDYTLRMVFPHPFGILPERLARFRPAPYLPAHYMKQFHPKYVSQVELDNLVRERGYDNWVSLFADERYWYNNPNIPTIFAYKVTNRFNEPIQVAERNPYYWKVDVAGNQLPYIDRIQRQLLADREATLLQVLAGEVDYVSQKYTGAAENYSLLKSNESKGNFKIIPALQWPTAVGAILFNYSNSDVVLRDILLEKNFRVALSIALDRDQINNILFGGAFAVQQISPPHGPPFHGEDAKFAQYTDYNPEMANRLLDEMGLRWDASHQHRLRPDGRPLELVMIIQERPDFDYVAMAEMYKDFWTDIGIELNIRSLASAGGAGGLFRETMLAGKYDVAIRFLTFGGIPPILTALRNEAVPIDEEWHVNPPWASWVISGGTKGDRPPSEYREIVERLHKINSEYVAEPDPQVRNDLTKEIFDIYAENLLVVNGLMLPHDLELGSYKVIHNRLRNVPIPVPAERYYTHPASVAIQE